MHTQLKTKIGVLLVNLGTPDSCNVADVSSFLKEFLLDGRVIDAPYLLRQLLVRLFIVPKRKKRIAETYKSIWSDKGSPLAHYSSALKEKLQSALGDDYYVSLGMRYQSPTLRSALLELEKVGAKSMIIIPLFPQHASATSGSIIEQVMRFIMRWNVFPHMHILSDFYNHPQFILSHVALAQKQILSEYDHILFSFHGLPERHVEKARLFNANFCYKKSCYETAALIAEKLSLASSEYTVAFQSRLGKEIWCQPYMSDVIESLAKKGAKKVLVFSPSFVADCLETLYEIKVELQEEFKQHGGEKIDLVEGLNANDVWVDALKKIIQEIRK